MGKYTHEQTAYVNTYKNRTAVVTDHAHPDRNTCNTRTPFVVQGGIVGSERFRGCWLVPKKQ
jgi:hypothetical protein